MIDARDIHSLTDFQRNTKQHLRRLKKTGHPAVLTINGRARVIVQDVARSWQMVAELETPDEIAAVKRGLSEMERGEGRPMNDVFNDIERKLAARAAGTHRRRKAS